MLIWCSRRSCVIGKFTVNDEVVEVAPVNFLQELLDESVLAGTTPDYCIILVSKEEADRHNCKIACKDRRPSCAALMNFLTDQSEHSRYTWSAYVHVEKTHLVLLGKQKRQLCGHCAFTYSSLARKHKDLMLDRFQLVSYDCDCRIDLEFSRGAKRLVWASLAGGLFTGFWRVCAGTVLIRVLRYFFIHIRNYNFNVEVMNPMYVSLSNDNTQRKPDHHLNRTCTSCFLLMDWWWTTKDCISTMIAYPWIFRIFILLDIWSFWAVIFN